MGGWMDPRTGLDVIETRNIPYPYPESNSNSSVVQAVAQSLYRQRYPGSILK
jgi:hypothetical protein